MKNLGRDEVSFHDGVWTAQQADIALLAQCLCFCTLQ